MQVTNTLNIDISTEIKTPSATPASGADRDFSSVLDTQTTSSRTPSESRSQSRTEARTATSSTRTEAEKSTDKSDNKPKKTEVSDSKSEQVSSEKIARDDRVAADKSDGDSTPDDKSDRPESSADLSQLSPDVDDTLPTIDPSLTGIDFLQHLQTSLTTNTELARASDLVACENGEDAADEAAIDGNSLPPDVLSQEAAEDVDLLGEAAIAARARAKEGGAIVDSKPTGEMDGSTTVDTPAQEYADEPVVAVPGKEKTTFADSSLPESADEFMVAAAAVTGQAKPISVSSRDSSAELAQLAALFAGGSKREVASPATAAAEETITSLDAAAQEAAASAGVTGKLESSQSGSTSAGDGSLPESAGHMKSLSESVRSGATDTGTAYQQILQRASTDGAEATAQGRDKSMLFSAVHLANAQQAAPELAQRMTLMIGQKWHEAEIQLEPQGLGKMSIQLSIDQDQKANVQFVVQQGNARELLEHALPKLRDMLANQGVQLGQTSVQQQAAGQQQSQGQLAQQGQGRGEGGSGWQRGQNSQGEAVDVQNLAIHSTGAAGIDFYA